MIPQPPPGQGPIDPRAAFSAGPAAGMPRLPGTPPVFAPPAMMQQATPPTGYPPPQMPPLYAPPGKMPPYGSGTPRRGVGRAIFMTMLIVILLISVFLNFVSLAGDGIGAGGMAVQQTIQPGNATEKVAVVPLEGIIDDGAALRFSQYLDFAQKDKNVKAVVIAINSPGGTVTGSDEIYARIRRFKSAKNIPVVVTMGSMATSGGYYSACAADYIFAQPTTLTGNIGVLMPRYNVSALMEKYGVAETTIVSTGANFKNVGSGTSPETPEGTAYLQKLADSMFAKFKSVVTAGRGAKLTGKIDDIANGMVYTTQEALAHGLIDKEGYAEDAYAYAAQSLTKPMVVRYETPPTLMERLMSSKSALGNVTARSPGGVTINIDSSFLNELTTPRPLYLWRGQ